MVSSRLPGAAVIWRLLSELDMTRLLTATSVYLANHRPLSSGHSRGRCAIGYHCSDVTPWLKLYGYDKPVYLKPVARVQFFDKNNVSALPIAYIDTVLQ